MRGRAGGEGWKSGKGRVLGREEERAREEKKRKGERARDGKGGRGGRRREGWRRGGEGFKGKGRMHDCVLKWLSYPGLKSWWWCAIFPLLFGAVANNLWVDSTTHTIHQLGIQLGQRVACVEEKEWQKMRTRWNLQVNEEINDIWQVPLFIISS